MIASPAQPVAPSVASKHLVGHPHAREIMAIVKAPVDQAPGGHLVGMDDPYSGALDHAMPEPQIETSRVARGDAVKLLARLAKDKQLQRILARRLTNPDESLRETSRALRMPMGVVQRRCQWMARFEQVGRLFRGNGNVAEAQAQRRMRERVGNAVAIEAES